MCADKKVMGDAESPRPLSGGGVKCSLYCDSLEGLMAENDNFYSLLHLAPLRALRRMKRRSQESGMESIQGPL